MATDLLISQAGATTFTLFPTMPAELRVKVWYYALEEKKAVCIEHNVYKSDVNDDSTKGQYLSPCSFTRYTSILRLS